MHAYQITYAPTARRAHQYLSHRRVQSQDVILGFPLVHLAVLLRGAD